MTERSFAGKRFLLDADVARLGRFQLRQGEGQHAILQFGQRLTTAWTEQV
jgi:hypothetical protein